MGQRAKYNRNTRATHTAYLLEVDPLPSLILGIYVIDKSMETLTIRNHLTQLQGMAKNQTVTSQRLQKYLGGIVVSDDSFIKVVIFWPSGPNFASN